MFISLHVANLITLGSGCFVRGVFSADKKCSRIFVVSSLYDWLVLLCFFVREGASMT